MISDFDECASHSHNCDLAASCSNTEGSFTCSCNNGYIGDGHQCSGVFHQHIDFSLQIVSPSCLIFDHLSNSSSQPNPLTVFDSLNYFGNRTKAMTTSKQTCA